MAPQRSAARKDVPAPVVSPARAALARVAGQFQVSLAPFPESDQAVAFKADAEQALAVGITSAETHRMALQLLLDGKRLKRAIDEHWQKVTRWLEDRKKDIRTIAAMDLETVEPGLHSLNAVILAYEDAERERVRRQVEQERREQERLAQEQRDQVLADMEQLAQQAEGASDDLSDRERAFVQRCYASVGLDLTSALWLNAAAASCGFKQDGYGVLLSKRPKIQYALEALRKAQALREQATAVAEKPIEIRQPEVESHTAKVSGTRTVTTWTAECVDFDLFIDKFVAGEVTRGLFRELVMPNAVAGNEKARALKENVDRIPGWRHIKRVTKAG